MNLMARYPDKHFDLAIVDPPYGIGENWTKDTDSKFYTHRSTYKNDKTPDKKYFNELFRVSDKQIIFGANYYTEYLPPRNSWIVWDKMRSACTFNSQCELAWTSFNIPVRIISLKWNGFDTCGPRHGKHPHEKPVALYKWLLSKYTRPGWKILDTHLGSGSIAIACEELGFDLTACEINEDYYKDAMERIGEYHKQMRIDFHESFMDGCRYLRDVETEVTAPTLFSVSEEAGDEGKA
jgi:site-specific DNA-methyltransferase (adenine-specific)